MDYEKLRGDLRQVFGAKLTDAELDAAIALVRAAASSSEDPSKIEAGPWAPFRSPGPWDPFQSPGPWYPFRGPTAAEIRRVIGDPFEAVTGSAEPIWPYNQNRPQYDDQPLLARRRQRRPDGPIGPDDLPIEWRSSDNEPVRI